MMTPPELYKIWCRHVPATGPVDLMTIDQFLAAAADVMAALQDAHTRGAAMYHQQDDATTTAEEVIK